MRLGSVILEREGIASEVFRDGVKRANGCIAAASAPAVGGNWFGSGGVLSGIQVSSQSRFVGIFPFGRYWGQSATLVIEFESEPPRFVLTTNKSWAGPCLSGQGGNVL